MINSFNLLIGKIIACYRQNYKDTVSSKIRLYFDDRSLNNLFNLFFFSADNKPDFIEILIFLF